MKVLQRIVQWLIQPLARIIAWLNFVPEKKVYHLTQPWHIAKARRREDREFRKKGYGEMSPEYLPQSRWFGAFTRLGRCVGVIRIIVGENSPLLTQFTFKEDFELWEDLAIQGKLEEVGTAAVSKNWQRTMVAPMLYRAAYTDAKLRGVEFWGAVMEPPKIKAMNRFSHFTFKVVSEIRWYMGGKCASHIMVLAEGEANMGRLDPEQLRWFTADVPQPDLIPALPASSPQCS